MQPDQNQDSNKPNDEHRLDFIMETEVPKEKTLAQKLKSPAGLVLLVVGSLLLLGLILLFVVLGQKANDEQVERLTAVMSSQEEVIRLSELAQQQGGSASVKGQAARILDVVSGDRDNLKQFLSQRGSSPSAGQSEENSASDSQIVQAIRENNFDEVYSSLIEEQLLEYQRLLLAAAKGANDEETKFLNSSYEKVNELLGVADQESSPEPAADNP